jgi:uncharacterized membrane protein
MDVAFRLVLLLHVLLTVVALGFNLTYNIWVGRAERDPEHLDFVLRGIKLLDDRFANPAYVVLFVTGVALVPLSDRAEFADFWVWSSTVLWAAAIAGAYLGYTPRLRTQIAALAASGSASPEYARAKRRVDGSGRLLGLLVVAIVVLMVVKPELG